MIRVMLPPQRKKPRLRGLVRGTIGYGLTATDKQSLIRLSPSVKSINRPLYGGHMESLPVSMCYYFDPRAKSGMGSEVPGNGQESSRTRFLTADGLAPKGKRKQWAGNSL